MTTQLEHVLPTAVGDPRPATNPPAKGTERFALTSVAGRLHGTTVLRRQRADDGFSASGRVVARLMDEVLTAAFAPDGLIVSPGRLEVDHIAPVPFDAPVAVTTWVTHREGRRIYAAATLVASGCVLVQAQGAYLVTDLAGN